MPSALAPRAYTASRDDAPLHPVVLSMRLLDHYDTVSEQLAGIQTEEDYPLIQAHLNSAKQEIAQSPVKKGKVQLDDFLEAELSQEPQVGFIIGVGASDVAGVLLPIATSLTYNIAPEKVLVTGAVSYWTKLAPSHCEATGSPFHHLFQSSRRLRREDPSLRHSGHPVQRALCQSR